MADQPPEENETQDALRGRHGIVPLNLFWDDQLAQNPQLRDFPDLHEQFSLLDRAIAGLEKAIKADCPCDQATFLVLQTIGEQTQEQDELRRMPFIWQQFAARDAYLRELKHRKFS